MSERTFGETTEPSSLVVNLIYSVWLFKTNDKGNLLFGVLYHTIPIRISHNNHNIISHHVLISNNLTYGPLKWWDILKLKADRPSLCLLHFSHGFQPA